MKYFSVLLLTLTALSQSPPSGIPDLATGVLPDFAALHDVGAGSVHHDGAPALQLTFGVEAPWPNLSFQSPEGGWDWRPYAGLRIGLFNPEAEDVTVHLRVDNAGANGAEHCNTTEQRVGPGEAAELTLYFNTADRKRFWGMRGIPVRGPMGTGAPLDLAAITGWQLFLNRPNQARTVLLTSVALFGEGGDLGEKVPFPFIDPFGQYAHADWPGKIHSEEALRAAHERERATRDMSHMPARDEYGGWLEGPALEATGRFRTVEIDGQWWLVTPSGRLFFSAGVDCVGTWSQTFIEGRADWFGWLPDPGDTRFEAASGHATGAHSMAETIGGEGKTFGFYAANLIRLHGPGWQQAWRENTIARLRAWGFNTIGNWSQWDVLRDGDLPFVANLGISGVRPIAAASGYWAKMMDVYDAGFAPAVDEAIQRGTAPWRDNARCIGYFVDNELAWEGIVEGVLLSGGEQPARQAFTSFLQGRHASLEALNAAWGTTFADWDRIGAVPERNERMQQDLDAFLYEFSATYFRTIKAAIDRHAPGQLYLGARFAGAPEPAVRACAAHADVVSFNLYTRGLDAHRSRLFASLGKPVMIGEFHFGALDRGLFHPGLVPVADQAERGTAYVDYVTSLLRHPAVVGCHWFQYVDEPVTGRYYDGENYNIGLVDVTDQPYAPLVESASAVHRDLYTLRRSTSAAQTR